MLNFVVVLRQLPALRKIEQMAREKKVILAEREIARE